MVGKHLAPAVPRRVDFQANADDFRAVLLASLGFSNYYIRSRCDLSDGQIAYRLKKALIKRLDYRNGGSATAQLVVSQVEVTLVRRLKQDLLRIAERNGQQTKKRASRVVRRGRKPADAEDTGRSHQGRPRQGDGPGPEAAEQAE
jgi:hypothetical protein